MVYTAIQTRVASPKKLTQLEFLINIYLYFLKQKHRLELVEMRSYKELKIANAFWQNASIKRFGYSWVRQTKDLIHPKGLVACFCLKKRQRIVGTICLFDPLLIESFTAHVFEDTPLHYDKAKTFELGRLIISQEAQAGDSMNYLILLHACYKRSRAHRRTQWLAAAHKRGLQQLKFLGAEATVLADRARLSQKDNFQSYYFSAFQMEGSPNNYRAFLVNCDQQAMQNVAKKYLRKKWKRMRK